MSDVQKSLHHYQRGLLDTLSNPKKGVSPLKWGYYFWRMLHYCFIGLLSPIPRKDMDTFLDLVMQSLPCSICRNSFAIFRSIMSLDRFWEFSPLYAPSLYFFCAHEWVNLKRGVYDLQPSSSSSLTSSVPKTVVDELEPFETKSSSMHPVETHDLTTHAPAVKSQQQTTLEGMETIRSLSSSPLSLDCSKRLSFSDVYSQYIRMDRVQIVNDFFMVCFFVIEHYPDVDKANPNIQETRKQNAAFVRHLTRVFATRLFLVPQWRDIQKGYLDMTPTNQQLYTQKQTRQRDLFIQAMDETLHWDSNNSSELLKSLYGLAQRLLHHPMPLHAIMMCIQSNVVTH